MAENSLGRRIQMLRESNMMTREDFAKRIGVLRKTVVDWEEGKAIPTAQQILTIADFGGVDPRSLVEDPAQVAEADAAPAKPPVSEKKKMTVGVIVLVVGVAMLIGGVGLMRGLSGKLGSAAAPAASSSAAVEEIPPLPDYLALAPVDLAAWDLDGDGTAEQVNPEGRSILLIQDGVAYALAEPLAGGQTLTAQDGVFIVKNAQGESRIYSRLRDGGIWPAG